MNIINVQREMDKTIEQLQTENRVPSLFLHSCCAPCSSYVIAYLSDYFAMTVFFYNPNIYPQAEYIRRCEEQQRLIGDLNTKHPVHFIQGDFADALFYRASKGLEQEKEGGARCSACFALRLGETAKQAKQEKADYFATTLTISPLKNAAEINRIGKEMAETYGVNYLPSDFKKKNGYKRSIELSKTYNLYRQQYCGCVFSQQERRNEQKSKETGKE